MVVKIYKGSNNRSKIDIISLMIIMLLENHIINYVDFEKFNISKLTFYRYISYIRFILADFGFYHLELVYFYNVGYKLVKYS